MSGSCCVRRCDDPDCPVCTTVERGVADPADEELLVEVDGDLARRLGNPIRGGAPRLAAERERSGTSSSSRKGPTR